MTSKRDLFVKKSPELKKHLYKTTQDVQLVIGSAKVLVMKTLYYILFLSPLCKMAYQDDKRGKKQSLSLIAKPLPHNKTEKVRKS